MTSGSCFDLSRFKIMDPISATLAVIALATALGDLVELGIKLRGFCDGVKNNHKELARACERIPSDLQDLESLYRSNVEVIDKSPALTEAVTNLTWKITAILKNFETLSAAQPTSKSKGWVKLKATFKAPEVEAEIKSLKEAISNCYQSFQTLAVVRIETTLSQAQGDLAEVKLTAEQTRLAVQQLVALSADQRIEIQRMKQEVQQQLRGPITSPVTPPIRNSLTKSSRSQTLDFLNSQLLNVGKEVTRRTGLKVSDSLLRLVRPFVQHVPILSFHRPPEKRDRSLLKRVLSLLDGLEEDGTSIDEHAYALNSLGDIFSSLAMFHEAYTVYTWAIDLYRILAQFQPDDFKPYLAEALCSLVWPLDQIGESPTAAIEEAIELLRPMSGPNSPPDIRCQFALQLAIKHRFPGTAGAQGSRLQDFDDAINILESILKGDPRFLELFGALDDKVDLASHLDSTLAKRGQKETHVPAIASSPLTDDLELVGYEVFLLRYSLVLEGASIARRDIDDVSMYTSEKYLLKAATADSYLASTYPDTDMDIILARRLTHFLTNAIPIERKLGYIEVSVGILRHASEYDPKVYTSDKSHVLSKKAQLLRDLDKRDEAHGTWSEIAGLDSSLIKDQHGLGRALELASNNVRHLGRLEEAIALRLRATEIYRSQPKSDSSAEAFARCNLGYDYQLVCQYQEALQTIELAAGQFQVLTSQSPSQDAGGLAWSLSTWRDCLVLSWSQDIPVDINQIKTLFEHYDFLTRRNIAFLNQYLETITTFISGVANPDIAIQLNLEAIERLQKLASEFPEDVNSKLQERLVEHNLLVNSLVSSSDSIDDTPPPLPW